MKSACTDKCLTRALLISVLKKFPYKSFSFINLHNCTVCSRSQAALTYRPCKLYAKMIIMNNNWHSKSNLAASASISMPQRLCRVHVASKPVTDITSNLSSFIWKIGHKFPHVRERRLRLMGLRMQQLPC
jgi:hypothetical protein